MSGEQISAGTNQQAIDIDAEVIGILATADIDPGGENLHTGRALHGDQNPEEKTGSECHVKACRSGRGQEGQQEDRSETHNHGAADGRCRNNCWPNTVAHINCQKR